MILTRVISLIKKVGKRNQPVIDNTTKPNKSSRKDKSITVENTLPTKLSPKERRELEQKFNEFEYVDYSHAMHARIKLVETAFAIYLLLIFCEENGSLSFQKLFTPPALEMKYILHLLVLWTTISFLLYKFRVIDKLDKFLWMLTEISGDALLLMGIFFYTFVNKFCCTKCERVDPPPWYKEPTVGACVLMFCLCGDIYMKIRILRNAIQKRSATFHKIKKMGAVSANFPFTNDVITTCGCIKIIEIVPNIIVFFQLYVNRSNYNLITYLYKDMSICLIWTTIISIVAFIPVLVVYLCHTCEEINKILLFRIDMHISTSIFILHIIFHVVCIIVDLRYVINAGTISMLLMFAPITSFFWQAKVLKAIKKAGTYRDVGTPTDVKLELGPCTFNLIAIKGEHVTTESKDISTEMMTSAV